MSAVLVTGAAGFVGSHVAERLLARGETVVGLDVFNDYYDPALKEARAARLAERVGFHMERMDFADAPAVKALVREAGIRRVVHVGAQAGVRYSIDNPFAYERSNLAGHLAVLEACREAPGFEHLVYASSSSVYGDRPASGAAFNEDDRVDAPVSLYAATKRACELMSTTYGRLFAIPQSGLRFFTVYGPWGRPDMAYYSFTRKITAGEPIEVYGEGRMRRDFTYIDDIVEGVRRVLDRVPEGDPAWSGNTPDPGTSRAPYRLYNIGNNNPVELMDLIGALEAALGRRAEKLMLPIQPGDVPATFADVDDLGRDVGFRPATPIAEGVRRFVAWYREEWEPLASRPAGDAAPA